MKDALSRNLDAFVFALSRFYVKDSVSVTPNYWVCNKALSRRGAGVISFVIIFLGTTTTHRTRVLLVTLVSRASLWPTTCHCLVNALSASMHYYIIILHALHFSIKTNYSQRYVSINLLRIGTIISGLNV